VLVLIAMVALLVRLHLGEPRLTTLENPERALALIVGRSMDVRVALAGATRWERLLFTLTLTDTGGEVDQEIAWYDELAAHSVSPDVDLGLAVLLGEAERRDRLERMLRQWRVRGEPLAGEGEVLAAAYLGTGHVDADRARDTLDDLGPGWFADALALRLAGPLNQPALAESAQAAMAGRARRMLWRMRALIGLDAGLLLLGVLALRGRWRRRAGQPTVADAALPPPWSLGAGLTALVRGSALAALVLLTLLVGNHWLAEQPVLAEALDQPLMYLPLLLLVWRALLAPSGLGFVRAFGLWPRPRSWSACLQATVALAAAGIVIDLGLGLLAEPLGLSSHWTEWFDADLAWGAPAAVAVSLLGSIVFAPLFEELIFRGVLYGTLRGRLAWPLAALGSALVFAVAHGYGVAGFLSVFLSGLLWAWVYERTGSLLPAMAAHVANNAGVAVTLIALLR
jgi:membrane protease YdiL (CAAX protease family)